MGGKKKDMANPVIREQYIMNSNIENNLQKILTSTEYLLVCGFHEESHHSIRAVL